MTWYSFLVVAIGLANACAFAQEREVIGLSSEFEIPRTARFQKLDADGGTIDKNLVLQAIAKAMYKASAIEKAAPSVRREDGDILSLRGIQIDVEPGAFVVRYVNGKQFASTGAVIATRSRVTLPYSLAENDSMYEVAFGLPEIMNIEYGNMSLSTLPPLRSERVLIADVKNIYTHFHATIPLVKTLRGELNTPFQADVLAHALMGGGGCTKRGGEGFMCDFRRRRLQVSVLPYKTGSRIGYEYAHHYLLDSQGGSTYDPEIINALEMNIQEVTQHK